MSKIRSSISEKWQIDRKDLAPTLTSPNFVDGDLSFIFQILISQNIRKTISFNLFLYSSTKQKITIVSTLIIEHPKGPIYSKPIYMTGICTDKSNSIDVKTNITLGELTNGGFFDENGVLKISINVSTVEQVLLNNEFFNTIPSVNDIMKALFTEHNLTTTCNLSSNDISWICAASSKIMLSQPIFLKLKIPLIIVGDIIGEFTDLIRIFKLYGFPGSANYLFLGNYIGIGLDNVDTLLLLLTFKILYPENLFLLRGNNETDNPLYSTSLKDECLRKKCSFSSFVSVFDSMPIAAVVGEKIFCVHSGISPSIQNITLDNRPEPIPSSGLIFDLLRSDTSSSISHYAIDQRDQSTIFGSKALQEFLDKNNYELVVRGHRCSSEGFSFPFGKETLISLFSASGAFGNNNGSVMIISEKMEYTFFTHNPLTKEEIDNFFRHDIISSII